MANNAKILNARSTELAKTVAGLGKEIHVHLLNLMGHVIEHRDVTVCDIFYKAVAKSYTNKATGKEEKASIVRSEAIKRWLKDFAFVSFSTDKPSTLDSKAYNAANGDSFKDHKARARVTVWNRYTPEPNAVTTSFELDSVIDRHINAIFAELEKAQKGEDRYARQTAKAKAGNVFTSDRLDAIRELRKAEAA